MIEILSVLALIVTVTISYFIITGKGAPDLPEIGRGGRGILRRAVPDWLRSPAFRLHVSGYENAGRRHGGEGALYVRLRRRETRRD